MRPEKKLIRIALVGQPNVGKSMLINSISNARLHVGNFTGVTVEKAEAFFETDRYRINIIDLPGTYSLNDYSPDEKVTKKFLMEEEYDIIINVLDSTNLEKNLLLTTELLELNHKMIVTLNMTDEAEKEGLKIDETVIAEVLGLPVIKVSAMTKLGINTLIQEAIHTFENPTRPSKLVFSDAIEEEIAVITRFLDEKKYFGPMIHRDIAVKLLKEDKETYQFLKEEPLWIELLPIMREALEHMYIHYDTKDIDEIFTEEKCLCKRDLYGSRHVRQSDWEEKYHSANRCDPDQQIRRDSHFPLFYVGPFPADIRVGIDPDGLYRCLFRHTR